MRVRQTSCRHCGQDIEGFSPYRRGEWRDRGNNTHCPAYKQWNAEALEMQPMDAPEGQLHAPYQMLAHRVPNKMLARKVVNR